MHGFLIKNFSGYADENGKSLQKYNLQNGFQNTSIKIEKMIFLYRGREHMVCILMF